MRISILLTFAAALLGSAGNNANASEYGSQNAVQYWQPPAIVAQPVYVYYIVQPYYSSVDEVTPIREESPSHAISAGDQVNSRATNWHNAPAVAESQVPYEIY